VCEFGSVGVWELWSRGVLECRSLLVCAGSDIAELELLELLLFIF
jgi:hypothetical protein